MKRLLLLLLLASPLLGQTKESLEQRVSPKPSGTAGDIPYAVNTTTIGWIPHATGLQCLTQNGTATPAWAACASGSSPLTTKGDIYTFSTVNDRLPVGTNGFVLEADSTAATGLKWVDPNVSSTGWVKLQASYPGSQQVGHFNVDGSSGAGPMTLTYSPSSAGVPGTYDLLTMQTDAAVVANSRYRMLFGDPSFTDRQLSFSYLAATYSGGTVGSWNLVRSDKNIGGGITLMQKNSALNMTMCIATDMASGSSYPAVCDTAFGTPLAVGVIGTNPGFMVTATGDISTIHGATYSWPLTVPVGASCLRSSTGVLSWDSACGTGPTGGTVTSVATSAPITGGTITSTGTIGISITTANDGGAVVKQASTPGTAQTGNANLSGTIVAGTFSGPLTGNVTGNVTGNLTGTADVANALGTTGSPVVVNTTAPSGSSQACVTTTTTNCTWQTVSTGGSGNVTVAVKGDIQTYTTVPGNLSVGTNGQVVSADSSTATGLAYIWPGIGTLRTLKETVFAGITPASYSNGSTTTIDGSGYTCAISGNGAVAIVATGLSLKNGTTSGGETGMTISPGATGDFLTQMGEARFRRGNWAYWVRLASYAYTNASGSVYGGTDIRTTYPKWGVALRRDKNLYGTPNTATGGIGPVAWFNNSEPAINFYPGANTSDVWMAYFRTPLIVDIYMGVYSGGWPTMEAMTLLGTVNMMGSLQNVTAAAGASNPLNGASSVSIVFGLGGSTATSGTYEIIMDRWRLTTWE